MSSQPPPSNDKDPKANEKATKAGPTKALVPPEEKFWERYSPHQEMPLSGVGSFTLHFLAIGLVVLMAIGVIKLGVPPKVSVEIQPIEPGGGGSLDGDDGDNPGTAGGSKRPEEAVKERDQSADNTPRPE